jgi:hypothetical protein
MQTERRILLHLVALGRVTPAEAERLLIAWNEGRDGLWVFAACIAVSFLAQLNLPQLLPGLMHIAHALIMGSSIPLHRTPLLLIQLLGGIL